MIAALLVITFFTTKIIFEYFINYSTQAYKRGSRVMFSSVILKKQQSPIKNNSRHPIMDPDVDFNLFETNDQEENLQGSTNSEAIRRSRS